jgi:hypothetical protein
MNITYDRKEYYSLSKIKNIADDIQNDFKNEAEHIKEVWGDYHDKTKLYERIHQEVIVAFNMMINHLEETKE